MSSPTLFILCGNAAYNRGDRGNLSAQITLLRSAYPQARIIVGSYRAEQDRAWYDCEVIDRGFFCSRAMRRALRQADTVIWGGGALLADNSCKLLIPHWVLLLGLIKYVFRKPIVAWAHGLVIETRTGAFFARHALNMCYRITARDAGSVATLERLGIRRPYSLTADPAVLLEADGPDVGAALLRDIGIDRTDRPIFAIAPTFWPFYQESKDILPYLLAKPLGLRRRRSEKAVREFCVRLAELARTMIDVHGATILLLPVYPSGVWEDRRLLELIRTHIADNAHVRILEKDDYSPRAYLSLWHHVSFTLTNSLHHGIFSSIMDVPCVNIAYESKCSDFFTAIGAADRCVPMSKMKTRKGRALIAARMKHSLMHWPLLRADARAGLEPLRQQARKNLDLLRQPTPSANELAASRKPRKARPKNQSHTMPV